MIVLILLGLTADASSVVSICTVIAKYVVYRGDPLDISCAID